MRDIPRPLKVAPVALLVLLLAHLGTAVSSAQIEATPIKSEEEVLKGIKALRILVAEMSAGEATLGVTREAVEAQAKKILEEKLPALKDRKSTRLNSSHIQKSRMPSSA